MKQLIPIKKAFNLILETIQPINNKKRVSIENSLNEILAENIYAKIASPRFNNAAMDGYAINYSREIKEFQIKDSIYAGDNKDININENEAIEITTGAKVPNNLNSVIAIEDVEKIDNKIIIKKELKPFLNIRKKGEEFNKNDLIIEKGTEITSKEIALLSSQGITNIEIFKKPSIAIVSNGNELKEPFEKLDNESEIYNSNSYSIYSLLKEYNFQADIIPTLKDDLNQIKNIIKDLLKYDVIIFSAGISFSNRDFIFNALQEYNLEVVFRNINLKPGKPTMFAKIDSTYIFALPGNPISAYTNTLFLVIPALRKLSHAKNYYFNFVYAKNKTKFKANPKKDHIALGILENGEWEVIDNYKYSSYMLSKLRKANSFTILEKGKNYEFMKIIPFNINFIDKNYI